MIMYDEHPISECNAIHFNCLRMLVMYTVQLESVECRVYINQWHSSALRTGKLSDRLPPYSLDALISTYQSPGCKHTHTPQPLLLCCLLTLVL